MPALFNGVLITSTRICTQHRLGKLSAIKQLEKYSRWQLWRPNLYQYHGVFLQGLANRSPNR